MKAIIIDDEAKARSLLLTLLTDYCPEITEIETAEDLPSGVRKINSFSPDLIFLDIEMPGYSGIQLLDFFEADQVNFEIIFTTAYSEYAIKAFQLNAIDYLLKPLRIKQVKEAVAKVMKKNGKTSISKKLDELKQTFESTNFKKIGLPVSDGILFVEFSDIIMLSADGMYTNVFRKDEAPLLISKPLKFFTDLMGEAPGFYRTHRSYLINLKHIKQLVKKDGMYIIMDNDEEVALSKDKKEAFLSLMQNL